MTKPVVCGWRPVVSIDRYGVQTGQVEIMLFRRTPCDARRSRLGVWT